MDTLNQSEFTASEKEDIVKMVDFFESKISVSGNDFNKPYKEFIQSLVNDGNSILDSTFNYEEQREMLTSINANTKSEIWSKAKSRAFYSFNGEKLKEPIKYESLAISIDGKYIKLLDKIAKKDEKIKYYVTKAKEAGDFPMFYNLSGLLIGVDNKWVDFNEGHWRLIVSIQILTMLENDKRHMELAE